MNTTPKALHHLLCAVGNPVAELGGIAPGHPEFLEAQVIRAGVGVLAKTPEAFRTIQQAIRIRDARSVSPRARAHLTAAAAWLAGKPVLAADSYAAILEKWPHDLLALRLAQSSYFYLGLHDRLCNVVDFVIPAWGRDDPDRVYVLAMASFAHAEIGDAAYAEALGRLALAIEPSCPMGVHAVAHAIAESGRTRDGARWMRDQDAQWATRSRMRSHNAWHLAMFEVEEGNVQPAIAILDQWLLPAGARSALDACDAVALLWQLTAEGIDDAGRWRRISDAFEQTLTPGFWPYVDLHAGIAHLRAGVPERMRKLMLAVAHQALDVTYAARRAREITLPGLRALSAWSQGRYGEAATLLAGLRPALDGMGGSRIQLGIFHQIEQDATRRHRTERVDQRPLESAGTVMWDDPAPIAA